MVRRAAIYWTLVVRDTVMVSLAEPWLRAMAQEIAALRRVEHDPLQEPVSTRTSPGGRLFRDRALGRERRRPLVDRPRRKQDWYVGSRVLRLLRHQFELVGHLTELGERSDVHLSHRPATVDFHRSFGDADIASNLFAKATARYLNHDLALPGA